MYAGGQLPVAGMQGMQYSPVSAGMAQAAAMVNFLYFSTKWLLEQFWRGTERKPLSCYMPKDLLSLQAPVRVSSWPKMSAWLSWKEQDMLQLCFALLNRHSLKRAIYLAKQNYWISRIVDSFPSQIQSNAYRYKLRKDIYETEAFGCVYPKEATHSCL